MADVAVATLPQVRARGRTLPGDVWRRFRRNRPAPLGLVIVLAPVAVLGFNLPGDGLRDALDPRLRRP